MNKIIELCPKFVDLTNTGHLELIKKIVDRIIANYDLNDIVVKEKELISRNDPSLIFVLLALKLAKSKLALAGLKGPVFISVVFAVYKEHNRIKKKSEHPHGEDFLRRKVLQLEWLFENKGNIQWEMIVVDDGCPEGSGVIAQEIIDKNGLNDRVRVLFLNDAIESKLPIAQNLKTIDDSQKGGAIIYGLWEATRQKRAENQIVVYTDADLSTHLGQTGLLLEPLLSHKGSVAIGSRREPESIVVKEGSRNDRGKLFIYLWKRLIPNLDEIIDTQCGFKAFDKDTASNVIEDLIETKFAFDIELLLKSELLKKESIVKVPVAWIDSDLASTTTDLQPYLSMLKSIVKMYRKYFRSNNTADEFASFIESLDEDSFDQIVKNIPEEILMREPSEFTEYAEVGVENLTSGFSLS
ncbi:MAG: hypothetical protein HKN25_00910 [Pyrinomonadaceae bacterium]|nr:hypothetical protein [Pyrinomonadaceae bacterium]